MMLGSYEMLKMAREMVQLWERYADRDPLARAVVDGWADLECAHTERDPLRRVEAGLDHVHAAVALRERLHLLEPHLRGDPACRIAALAAQAILDAPTIFRDRALAHAHAARSWAAELATPPVAGR